MSNREATSQPKSADSENACDMESDFADGKIRVNLIYDMKTGSLSMESRSPEIMLLGVLTQAVAMVGQKQLLKTLNDARKRSMIHRPV